MPPWSPDPNYTRFAHERRLDQSKIDLIAKWISDGSTRGDSTQEPQMPAFSDRSQLVNADFSKRIKTHVVKDTLDEFKFFALSSGLTATSYIKQLELVPGNRKIVHHAFIFLDTTGHFANLLAMDSNLSQHGNNYLSGGNVDSLKLIGSYLPGGSYYTAPDAFCYRIPKKSYYILQVHYAPGSYGQADSSQLNVKYTTDNALRSMTMKALLNNSDSFAGCAIFIPAKSIKTFTEKFTVPADMSLISITPHQHLLGKELLVYAYDPSTNDTIRLIDDHWNFHWQSIYTFPRAIHIPAKYVIQAEGTYNNTSDNPDNPFSPPQDMKAETSTHTEMMQVFFAYVPYKTGDENLVFDSTALGTVTTGIKETGTPSISSFGLYPNPAHSGSELQIELKKQAIFTASLYSADGKKIKVYTAIDGSSKTALQLPELHSGVYILRIYNSQEVLTRKLIIE